MKHEKFKVTPLERAWILYDVGNSAFVLMIATLVPIFFNALAEAGGLSSVDYLAYWGYASSVVTVITAVLGPILGTLADTRGFKKPIFRHSASNPSTVGISLNLNFHLILKSTKCISIIRAINITVTTTTPAVGAKS